MAKVNITLDDRLLEKLDSYADQNFTSRSGLISTAVNQYLLQQEVFSLVKRMSVVLDKIADNGSVDDDTLTELEDFHRVCRTLTGQ